MIREQLQQMLGSTGFDYQRDIAGSYADFKKQSEEAWPAMGIIFIQRCPICHMPK